MGKGHLSVTMDQFTSFFPIQVEEGQSWIAFQLKFEAHQSWARAYLWDVEKSLRFCFLDGGNERNIVIHEQAETTSPIAVSGTIMPGTWLLEISTDVGKHVEVVWETGAGKLPAQYDSPQLHGDREYWNSGEKNAGFTMDNYDWNKIWQEGSRWYKGDFHTHTVLSDGKMTQLMNSDQAEKLGMDFFTATDHNVMSTSWPKGNVLVIPGVEVTSGDGHWNALGLRKWIDWRTSAPDGGLTTQAGMDRLMKETAEQGAVCSINHPMLVPWAWQYGETLLSAVHSMEIWNDPTYSPNPEATEKALKLWSECWNRGHRLTGIGGSDSHMLPTERYPDCDIPSLIGDPATYVWCDDLSAEAVLEGVRRGEVYVSRGPVLEATIRAGDREYRFGSDVSQAFADEQQAESERNITCSLSIYSETNILVSLVHNGTPESVKAAPAAGGSDPAVLEWIIPWEADAYHWYRFDVRDEEGRLLAFTNPIYFGEKQPEEITWNDLLSVTGMK
ncbi:CehA/McbA family metallohydrolase [Paenibacillus faecalis]|uniref:CehA/McbA family metallohydrolase n=1 Tax=Paenibacillus faecalis TaxID=2079532 RepID=UPI000D0F94F3|nr:CehA/McbA family metallohydrolase [Paenibacillus faecalis]